MMNLHWYDWLWLALWLCTIPVMVYVDRRMTRRHERMWREMRETDKQFHKAILEAILSPRETPEKP